MRGREPKRGVIEGEKEAEGEVRGKRERNEKTSWPLIRRTLKRRGR